MGTTGSSIPNILNIHHKSALFSHDYYDLSYF